MKTQEPSSHRGAVYNYDGDDLPNQPGWYWWRPLTGDRTPQYVMVDIHPELGDQLIVWIASERRTQPLAVMRGEWSFFNGLLSSQNNKETERTHAVADDFMMRDYFAGQALSRIADGVSEDENVAKWAYQLADAMIKQRGQK